MTIHPYPGIARRKTKVTPSQIIQMSCDYFDYHISFIIGKRRNPQFLFVRYMIMAYLRRNVEGMTLQGVGRLFDRDHSTVIHALKTHDSLYKYDHIYRTKYDNYIRFINIKISVE